MISWYQEFDCLISRNGYYFYIKKSNSWYQKMHFFISGNVFLDIKKCWINIKTAPHTFWPKIVSTCISVRNECRYHCCLCPHVCTVLSPPRLHFKLSSRKILSRCRLQTSMRRHKDIQIQLYLHVVQWYSPDKFLHMVDNFLVLFFLTELYNDRVTNGSSISSWMFALVNSRLLSWRYPICMLNAQSCLISNAALCELFSKW